MKKLLTILGAVGLTATTGATVVACGTDDKGNKDFYAEKLNGKTFEVELNSFTNDNSAVKQNQWGQNSVGALYASLWAINNKPASGEYPLVNKEVKAILTKGESVKRADVDDGHDVKINDKAINELIKEGQDWHTLVLEKDDVVNFDVEIISYSKNDKDELVSTPHKVNFSLKIVEGTSAK